jgi:3',5'-cyclic AMP phosphodiesterase CpdA
VSLNRRQLLYLTATSAISLPLLAHHTLSQSKSSPSSASVRPSASVHPSASDPVAPIRIVLISDLNSQYGSTTYEPEVDKAIALIPTLNPDLVLCGGDMVAGQSRALSQAQLTAMWDSFDRHIASPLRDANIPLGFTIGNHDGSGAKASGELIFAADRAIASQYWQANTPRLNFVDRTGFPFFYSFQLKDLFCLVWDASTATISAEQLAWVEKSLASEAAQKAKIRLAIGHLPLYGITVGRDKPGEYLDNAEGLRSLLEQYNVHTYISGHDHAYYPGHRGKLELLYSGLLGSGARSLLTGNVSPQKNLTIIDITFTGNQAETKYTTYDMKSDTESMVEVEMRSLPEKIITPTATVFRRDVSVD